MSDYIRNMATDDSLLFRFYDVESTHSGIIKYRVKEKYGCGDLIYIEISEGIFAVYANYLIDPIDDISEIKHSEDIVAMYQVLEGNVVSTIKDKKSVIVKNGDMISFAGNNEFYETKGYGNRIVAIGVFGYYKGVLKLFNDFFNGTEGQQLVGDYYNNMSELNSFLICRRDVKFKMLFHELLNNVQDSDRFLVKVNAIKLLYHGMINYSDYINEKRKIYDEYYIEKVYEIKKFLDLNWNKKVSIDEMSRVYKINKTYLKEIFKECYDISPHKYMVNLRLEKSKALLRNKEIKIEEIANMTGFSSAGRYTESFKKFFGYLPSQYRRQN